MNVSDELLFLPDLMGLPTRSVGSKLLFICKLGVEEVDG